MKTALLLVAICTVVIACREEFHPLPPPVDPPRSNQAVPPCQAPAIEQNIIGTWHFKTVVTSGEPVRVGLVSFDNQSRLIDADSLYPNSIDVGSSMAKVVSKVYNTNAAYSPLNNGYQGPIFRIDLIIADGRKEQWPMYVVSNECNQILIHRVGSYNSPIKQGFILTR